MSIDKICNIKRAGFNPNKVAQLELKSDTFNWTWFFSDTETARTVLAVALAAMTAGRAVECTLDDPATGSFGISAIFIVGDIANNLA